MRLTAIKLAGFKSFVEPTTLRLTSNLAGIVGPNGCGKSNVIDAVRWVTGESSAKQLRGEALEDVIFNGSRSRKPVGRASVELLFDNSDGKLGGQYAGFAEIAIRRELSRDGQSQYRINGARCRRRDVVDLFLGTGLGGRSNYAVIEQGSVNRLIEARPEDMRQVLEEAAGISRYKERRRETENRIRHTRENLDRLNDLISEVTQRLAQLQRQAANAEKYKQYKGEERRLRAELLALRWRELDGEAEHQQTQLDASKRELESQREQARDLAERRQTEQAEQQRATQASQQQQADFYAAEAEVARVEQSLAHARELARVKQAETRDMEGQLEDLDQRIDAVGRERTQLQQAIDDQGRQLEAAVAEHKQAQARLGSAEQAAEEGESAWESLAGDENNPLQRAETERARLEHLEQNLGALGERLDRLLAERGRIDDDGPKQALTDVEEALQALAGDLETAREDQQSAEADLTRLRDNRRAVDTTLHETRDALAAARGRLSSLEALQQAALREDDQELRDWLSARSWDDAASAAHQLRVADGWEAAAEAALGGFLRALCLPDLDARVGEVSEWPGQGLTLIHQDREDRGPHGAGGPRGTRSLSSVLSGPTVLRQLAQRIFLVENERDAHELVDQLQPGQMLVTRAGFCLGPGWLRVPRQDSDEPGVLKREQAIDGLHKEIDRLAATETDRADELDGLRQRIQAAETRRTELTERLDDLRRRHGERLAERQGLTVRVEQIQRRRRELDAEIDDLTRQRREHEQAVSRARERLDGTAEAARDFVQRRQALQEQLREQREQRDRARRECDEVAQRQQNLRLEVTSKRSALEAAEQRLSDLRQRRTRSAERLQSLQAELAQSAPETDLSHARAEAESRRDAARKALEAARTGLADIEARVADLSQRAQALETGLEAARERVQQARVAFESASVRRQTLEEQLAEAGYAPRPLCEELAEDAGPADWEEKLESLERRIQRLGAINLAAIEEFETEKEREEYLQGQYDDLMEALGTLEQAIARIDRETRSRFRDTYEQVNQRLGALFPVLFGGGEARLELTEDDLLATGVRIMARPPGKRNASIQMLSGGEKALTAVALLFALFELNPAPFCMLDEIDAPLDDANVSRFCDLVGRMAEQVQFIVITHNKLTMELVQQLHGVTMQEPGVSRLVSVDIDQALEMAS